MVISGLVFSNTALALTPPLPTSRLPLFRLYSSALNDHFYTTDYAEATTAQVSHGYRMESRMGYVDRTQMTGNVPLIRMWNPVAKKHFYTTDETEASQAQNAGFVREGLMGYVLRDTPPSNTSSPQGNFMLPQPITISRNVYRMYNSGLRKHFYTIDKPEMESLLMHGYRLEGSLGTLYSNLSDNDPCPDEWISNQMPSFGASGSIAGDYYIVNGQRVGLEVYDTEWIRTYCGLIPQVAV